MKFKKGDIVKGIEHNGYCVTNQDMYKAEVLTTEDDEMLIKILEHKDKFYKGDTFNVDNDDSKFTRIEFTKQDLLDMPLGTKIITDKKKEHNVFIKVEEDEYINDDSDILYDSDIMNDLSLDDSNCGDKIIRIEKPMYVIVYNRDNEVKEMTIAEISEALGYEVKIIKED